MQSLLAELNADQRSAITTLRDWLSKQFGARPSLSYIDVAWNWCEQYEPKKARTGDLTSVFLIPDPERVRVAVSYSRRFFETHPISSLPKGLHAGLSESVCVGHQAWTEWTISSQDDASTIIELLETMSSD